LIDEVLSKITECKIVGVDEAGRGPLAGPVVACALYPRVIIEGVDDSKSLSPERRFELFQRIVGNSDVAVGMATPGEIDRLNILRATRLAMMRALNLLFEKFDPDRVLVLVDGRNIHLPFFCMNIVEGDKKSYAIAAASIVAKVVRDSMMEAVDELYPSYGFAKHKGYPTKYHKDMIKKFGSIWLHRKTFRGVIE